MGINEFLDFSRFGLEGLVICALFAVLLWVLNQMSKHVKESRKERMETREEHRDERREWAHQHEKTTDRVVDAMRSIEAAIRDRR